MSAITAQHGPRSVAQPLHPAAVAVVVWAMSAAFTIAVLAAVIGAPLLQSSGHPAVAFKIYRIFSFLCHQIPERSFHLAGEQFAVCSRCTGLYAGFAMAIVTYPLFRSLHQTETPGIVWLFASAMPLAIDFSLTYFGVWQNNHFTRLTTGALFGAVAAIFVLPGVIELSRSIARRMKSVPRAVAGG